MDWWVGHGTVWANMVLGNNNVDLRVQSAGGSVWLAFVAWRRGTKHTCQRRGRRAGKHAIFNALTRYAIRRTWLTQPYHLLSCVITRLPIAVCQPTDACAKEVPY